MWLPSVCSAEYKPILATGIQTGPTLVSCPDCFHMRTGKRVLSTAYSIFLPSATMVALQSDCFMWMTSRTAINGDQWTLGTWSTTQETKPGRTRERPVKHDFYEWVVCVAELDNWRCEVPSSVYKIVSQISEVDRDFMLCQSWFLGIWKLREGWSLHWAVFLELFCSFNLCVMSHYTMLHHQFLNPMEQKWNRPLTSLFFPFACIKIVWERD